MPKVVLITGAAKRIGAACARRLHGEGWNVVLHYRSSKSDALSLAAELNGLRQDSAFPVNAELSRLDQVESLAGVACSLWGGVDALVNNASLFYPAAVGQICERDWDSVMGSNLKAPFFLAQALAATLAARAGCIVNIADIHAERGLPGYPVYSIAKAGLMAMTKILAKELAPKVRVNAVAPGAILWPENELTDSQQAEILSKVPLGYCGQVEDIAGAVRFLIEDAGYITGQILAVDGGRLLFS